MAVEWKPGFAPVLYLIDDNENVVETIELDPFTTDEIHELLASKGFIRNIPEEEEAQS